MYGSRVHDYDEFEFNSIIVKLKGDVKIKSILQDVGGMKISNQGGILRTGGETHLEDSH